MYIARDKDDNSVWLFKDKPVLDKSKTYFISLKYMNESIKLVEFEYNELNALFGIKNLTFENSPIELEVTIKTK